jgi:uncharacterized coiled-coil protein SlyX
LKKNSAQKMADDYAANPNGVESAVHARLTAQGVRLERFENAVVRCSGLVLEATQLATHVADTMDFQTDALEERLRGFELRLAAHELTVARLLDRAADHEGRLARLESGGGGQGTRLKDVESSVSALLAEVTVLVRAMSAIASVQEQ